MPNNLTGITRQYLQHSIKAMHIGFSSLLLSFFRHRTPLQLRNNKFPKKYYINLSDAKVTDASLHESYS
jgi:hypothetical protein